MWCRFRAEKRPCPGPVLALLLVVTEFSVIASVDVASGSCEVIQDTNPELADRCELSGFERNGGGFILLAVLAGGVGPGGGGRRAPCGYSRQRASRACGGRNDEQ